MEETETDRILKVSELIRLELQNRIQTLVTETEEKYNVKAFIRSDSLTHGKAHVFMAIDTKNLKF